MNFSEEWKSAWPISSVFSPPLLISGKAAKPLGPLLFTPSPKTLTLLFSSPSLSPQITPPFSFPLRNSIRTFTQNPEDKIIPSSIISSLEDGEDSEVQSSDDGTPPIVNNNLQTLRCPNGDLLVFFPTEENSDRVGFVVLSVNESNWKTRTDEDGNVFTTQHRFNSRIEKLSVISTDAADTKDSSWSGDSVITVGYLLVCTLYSVHWFSVDVRSLSSNSQEPILVHLGTKKFRSSVVHACWSPHLPDESLVLLESGKLLLFDLGFCSRADKLKGTLIKFSWNDLDCSSAGRWLSCDFSWHPQIFIIASCNTVFLVDWRSEEGNVSILTKIDMLDSNHSTRTDRFLAFAKVGFDGFYFTVATEHWLILFDIRKPLIPVLRWAHNLDSPRYINVFRLSELRSLSKEDKYTWASESGVAILVGSFWNCEFGLFCYGPSITAPDASFASKISKFCNSLYAWGFPSELSLSGRECQCGDCLVREDFVKANLPVWIDWRQKKETVLGFCILSKDLLASKFESDDCGGFTLIRLMSSGKLESQKFNVSWDFINMKSEDASEDALLNFQDHLLLYSLGNQKYQFPKRFKYLKLDYLYGYLNDNLAEVLGSNMRNLPLSPTGKKSFILDIQELICKKLKVFGVNQFGSFPPITNVFKDISLPTSVDEIASRRVWSGLPLHLLQLAFSSYSELLEVLVDQKKVSLEFLDVPNLPQLPPFFLRKPSSRSNKWSQKVQPGDALVGPALPLPILLTIHEIDKEKSCSALEEEASGFSAETELTHQCNEVLKVATNIVLPKFHTELNDSHAVSLANDRDEKWVGSQEPKPFFYYKPMAFSYKNNSSVNLIHDEPLIEDKRFATFISKMHEKEFATNPREELVGLEMFDDLCPIELKFDAPTMNFGPKELKGYKLLKRQFSKWQEGFKPYQDFCPPSKIPKREP